MKPEDYELTDAEWRRFQQIPEQGYSHRAWVNARIKERLAATWDDGYEDGVSDCSGGRPYKTTLNPYEDS